MPRKKLEWYEGAYLHITARGNHRNDIFRDETDFEVYINMIKDTLEYYNDKFILISFCLMTNHIHLQIKTTDMHVGRFIQKLNSYYAQHFNKKYNYVGHLFQGRYKAEILEEDRYILEVSRYIHLNPVRARMTCKPEEYRWSSYNNFINDIDEQFIKPQYILNYFKGKDPRNAYKEFVESAIKVDLEEEAI